MAVIPATKGASFNLPRRTLGFIDPQSLVLVALFFVFPHLITAICIVTLICISMVISRLGFSVSELFRKVNNHRVRVVKCGLN